LPTNFIINGRSNHSLHQTYSSKLPKFNGDFKRRTLRDLDGACFKFRRIMNETRSTP
jgi:hypothetical protein